MNILPQSFYNQSTLKVAQNLLGCFLVRKFTKDTKNIGYPMRCPIFLKIVETEAYVGHNDLASHASRGRTPRNQVMFGKPGIIYVYFTYGMHYMLNIVTEKENYPAAVLIRAVETPQHLKPNIYYLTNGPARLTKALQIDKSFNGLPIYTKKHGLWIAGRDQIIQPSQIKKTTRIGVDYAGKYKNKKWRFYLRGNKFVSKK